MVKETIHCVAEKKKTDFSRADWSRAIVDELHRKVGRRLEGNLSYK